MNKRLLYFLIVSICISLVGMIFVQFLWIRNAFQIKEAQFDRSVNEALGGAVNTLETSENMFFISRNFEGDSILSIVQAFSKDTNRILKEKLDSLLAMNDIYSLPGKPPPPKNHFRTPHTPPGVLHYSYHFQVFPDLQFPDSMMMKVEEFYHAMPDQGSMEFQFSWDDQIRQMDSLFEINQRKFELQANGDPFINTRNTSRPKPGIKSRESYEKNIQKLDNRAKRIQNVIKKMAIELETKPAPIQQRINKKNLQQILGGALSDKGIDLPFEFAVYTPSNDRNPIPIQSANFKKENLSTEHRVSLFPNDLFKKPDLLLIYFPGQKSHVFKSLSLLLVGSVIFTLIIVLSSGASIVVMIRQKKISDIKTDFINNMTHEFKTPIATISIAADSINNPRVITEPEKIRDYTRIIKEENNRMNTRVEQVLQMALLDSRDFNLKNTAVDMHSLIEKVSSHFRLQMERREGKLTLMFSASNFMVEADEDHMRNVIINLLDNANKYSASKPEIILSTYNRSGKFFFTVEDNGMGMSPETQHRIFDKFFRVTTGNIHKVKGFGLGLSYVKAIILAHKGEIGLSSEIGKGSRFEIGLPYIPGQMDLISG